MRWLICFVLCLSVGCSRSTDNKQREATEKIISESFREVGMPQIVNFTELKQMKSIYELRDKAKLLTYTYIVDLNGGLHFLTRSVGFGLPYGAQFTNPMKASGVHYPMPQPEPNGLFMPSSADATWIMAIDDDGAISPMYVEPRIIVSTIKIKSAKGNP